MQIPFFEPKHFNGAVELNHLGIVECQGADACHFLHQQLTQELMELPPGSSTMAGFCNAKGRLQASMVVVKDSNERLYLIMKKDLLERTLKRLSMFVLRAKVKLMDVSAAYSLIGVMGEHELNQSHSNGDLKIRAPLQAVLGLSRTLLALPQTSDQNKLQALFNEGSMTQEKWLFCEILSGVAWVDEKTFEHFVPQMLNFESTGAVSFKKGCYPGQEVVARSQFRGTLKRRTTIVFSKEPLHVGMEIFSALHATESCAEVLQVSQFEGLHWALACFQIDSLMRAIDPKNRADMFNDFLKKESFWTHCFGLGTGMNELVDLGFYPLPYALLEDI
jgi:folate-binding protein YgfZ